MQVQLEEISSVKRKVTIEVPADKVADEIRKSYANIQKKATLAGFRKGKAPLQMIKKMYSHSMQDEVMRKIYEQTLFKALEEHKIEAIDTPMVDDFELPEEGKPFKYSAIVEVLPKFQLGEHKGLEVKKERYVEDNDAVEAEISRMRENMAELVPVEEGTVENGMVLTVDYRLSIPDAPEEDSNGDGASIEVGAGRLIKGLEDGLLGMAIGETKEINVTMPEGEEYNQAAGKTAVFTITVKEMRKKELPELDDEFAQQFGEFETMDEMRTKLTEMRAEQNLSRIQFDLKTRIVDALIEKNPLEVPDSLVRRQLDFMLDNFKNRLKGQNMSLEQVGFNEDNFRKRFNDEAVQKVKGGLLVMALAEQEKIEVGEEELEARYAEIANNDPALVENIRNFYKAQSSALNSLIAEIKEDKAIQFLLDNAVVTEVAAGELQQTQETSEA